MKILRHQDDGIEIEGIGGTISCRGPVSTCDQSVQLQTEAELNLDRGFFFLLNLEINVQ